MQRVPASVARQRHVEFGLDSCGSRTFSRRHLGFTLLELLVASAVMVILIAAAVALFVSSGRAYDVSERLSLQQQEIESAAKILSYDLSLAGYRGTTLAALDRSFAQPFIAVEKNVSAGSDRIIMRYFEDDDDSRLFGAQSTCDPQPCVVRYDVALADDGSGTALLYRREGEAGDRIGIVQAVRHFRVLQYIRRVGDPVDIEAGTAVPDNLAAVNIEIAFENGGLWRFPVAINNPVALGAE